MILKDEESKTEDEILGFMEDLFSKDGTWTQSWLARDSAGVCCHVYSPEAVCFCLQGGLSRAVGENSNNPLLYSKVWILLAKTFTQKYPQANLAAGLVDWNDELGRTQGQILDLVQAARAQAKAQAVNKTAKEEKR